MKVKIKKEQFEEILKNFRMTKSMLARKAGISNVQISRMLNPKSYGSYRTAEKILISMPGISFEDIFFTVD